MTKESVEEMSSWPQLTEAKARRKTRARAAKPPWRVTGNWWRVAGGWPRADWRFAPSAESRVRRLRRGAVWIFMVFSG